MIPISLKSYSEFSTSEEFISSLYTLTDLQEKVSHDFDTLKIISEDFKKSRIQFIGNPFIRLQSKLLEVTYLLKLHILNCGVYNDLLFEDVQIDDNLNLQLESLLETTKDLCKRYEIIREVLNTTPYPSRSSQFI